jgi:hypothetical protein
MAQSIFHNQMDSFSIFFYNKKQNKLGANKKLEYNYLLIP